MDRVHQLAQEGHGAVEVDEAYVPPLKVFLGGPIKYWWGKYEDGTDIWGSHRHQQYIEWRDAVRVTVVQTGIAVTYSPHRAIQGAWHEDLQELNNTAIKLSDLFINLTPPGIPANGTASEIELAKEHGVMAIHVPPGQPEDLDKLTHILKNLYEL